MSQISTIIAPGIYNHEYDFSAYTSNLGDATLCVVGCATKGPLDTPILVTNPGDLVNNFGPPLTTDYGLQTALQFLKKGNQLVYLRVADRTACVAANITLAGTTGGTAATLGTGTVSFAGDAQPADGDTLTFYKLIPSATLTNTVNTAGGNVVTTTSSGAITVTGMAGGTGTTPATGTVAIPSTMPVTASLVTVSDGTTVKIFEFTTGSPSGGHVGVTIVAGNPYLTLGNFVTAVNGAGFNVHAVFSSGSPTVYEADSNGSIVSGHIGFLIGSTPAATLLNLIQAINNTTGLGIPAANITTTVPELSVISPNYGLNGNALILATGSVITPVGFTGGVAAVPGTSGNVVIFSAISPGTWGNAMQIVVRASTAINALPNAFDLLVYAQTSQSTSLELVEEFDNLSTDPTKSSNYVDIVINSGVNGLTNKSTYVVADMLANNGIPTPGTYTLGTGGGIVGADGIGTMESSDIVGTSTGQNSTGIQALYNSDTVEFNLLAVAGNSTETVIAAVAALEASRKDFFHIIDPPFGLNYTEVVAWHNGGQPGGVIDPPLTALNTSYAGVFWPWAQVDDPYTGVTLWLPPSGFFAAQCAYTDGIAGPWFAVAGYNRGVIDADAIETSPSLPQRNLLQGGTNRINPFVDSASSGITIQGNQTLLRTTSSLASINVRRLLLYAEKVIATAVRYLQWEPNDPITWKRYTTLVNPILANISQAQGLDSFYVICDSSTNPPAQVQGQRMMRARLFLVPTLAAEKIVNDYNIYQNGVVLIGTNQNQ